MKYKVALRTCAACPVRRQCLEFAMDNDVLFGIFGGTTAVERSQLRRFAGQPAKRIVRDVQPCGTMAAVKRHDRAGEKLCARCAEVKAVSQRRQRLARKARKTTREAAA